MRTSRANTMEPLLKTIRGFVKRNANILAGVLGLFIFIEGVTIVFYPNDWWKPITVIGAIGLIVLAWANIKSVFKAIISTVVTIMLAAGAIMAGYYYSASTGAGSAWGLTIILVWVASIAASYWIPSSKSRWTVAMVVTIISFLASYSTLMSAGTISIVMAATVLIGVITFILIMLEDKVTRSGSRSIQILKYDPKTEHGKVSKAMESLWPGIKESTIRFSRGKNAWLWHSAGDPAIILIPVDLNEDLEPSRRGLTYHGRDIRKILNWMLAKTESMIGNVSPIIILLDVRSMNEATRENASLITVPRLDSNKVSYVGLMGLDGSAGQVKHRLASCVSMFKNHDVLDDKRDGKLSGRFDGRNRGKIDIEFFKRSRNKDGGK